MTQISVSQARQDFSNLVNRVYAGEEFLVVKNKVPMAEIKPIKREKRTAKKRIVPGATTLLSHLKGSNVEIANWLRETAWKGRYDD